MSNTRTRLFLIIFLLAATMQTAKADKIQKLTLWVNAFIPQNISLPGGGFLTMTVPNGPDKGKTVIPFKFAGVNPFNNCFLTDQRSFDSDPSKSSRMHSEVQVDITGGKLLGTVQRCDPTVLVDCTSGAEECKSPGSTENMTVDSFTQSTSADGSSLIRFTFNGAAHNPCFKNFSPPIPNTVPDIDWSVLVTITIAPGGETGTVEVRGLVDVFPAFEMYMAVDGKPAVNLFQILPGPGKTPFDLYNNPLKPNDGNRTVDNGAGMPIKVAIGTSFDGTWASTDADKRFRLDIQGNSCTWTEKAPSGTTLARTATLKPALNGMRIERPNDDVVLAFLGFQPRLKQQILAAGPKSSFLIFSMSQNKLRASWFGLFAITDTRGNLKQLVQPGDRPPKMFVFSR